MNNILNLDRFPTSCKHCGSVDLEWFDAVRNASDATEGRLRSHDVRCWFVLGCNECSETLMTVPSGVIATAMNTQPQARPIEEYHEDYGYVVWFTLENGKWLGEPSYIGTPTCSDWPGYHTHFTPHPNFPILPKA